MIENNSERKLTELQFALAAEVLSCSLTQGYSIAFELAGSSETFIRCNIGPTSIFLYSDGFDLQGDGVDVRFEPDDIETPKEAIMSLRGALKHVFAL